METQKVLTYVGSGNFGRSHLDNEVREEQILCGHYREHVLEKLCSEQPAASLTVIMAQGDGVCRIPVVWLL